MAAALSAPLTLSPSKGGADFFGSPSSAAGPAFPASPHSNMATVLHELKTHVSTNSA